MPPFTVTAPKPPAPPASGGHFVQIAPGRFQLIHAVGPNQWQPGPPAPHAATHVNAQPGVSASGVNPDWLNPNKQLAGKALLQMGQGLANAQTRGPLTELAKQIAANEAQSQNAIDKTGGYFHELGQQTQQGVNQVQGIGAGLNQQLSDIGTQEQSQLQGIGQNATTNFQRYAPQSDAANSLGQPGMQQLATEIARQQGLAAQDQGAFRAFGATQGANYGSLAASNLGTFGLKGQEALKGIAQAGQLKNEPLMAKVAALQATRGSDLATALGRLRQQEITNQISRTGLGIKQQANLINQANNIRTTGTSAANNIRTTGTSAANNQRTNAQSNTNSLRNNDPTLVGSPAWARVQNAQGKDWSNNPAAVGSPAWARAQRAGAAGGGGAKPLTTQENNHFWATMGQIQQLIQDGQAHGQQGNISQFLQSGQNPSKRAFDPFMIRVADELLGYGSIDQATAAILHNQYGVRGGTFRGQPIKVTPTFNPNNPKQNPPSTAGRVGGALGNAGTAIGNAFGA